MTEPQELGTTVVGELDTRRFVKSTLVLVKAKRCIEKDCHLDQRKTTSNLASLLGSLRVNESNSRSLERTEGSSTVWRRPREPIDVLVLDSQNEEPALSTRSQSTDSFMHAGVLQSAAENVLKEAHRIQRDDSLQYKQPRSGFLRPLMKERVNSLMDPEANYYRKWEKMKDNRDSRELSLIRRNVRKEMIRDVSIAAFTEDKLQLKKAIERSKLSETRPLYEKNKQSKTITLQNIKLQAQASTLQKTMQAHALRTTLTCAEKMSTLMQLQDTEEKTELKTQRRTRLNDFTSSVIVPPKVLVDRFENAKRYFRLTRPLSLCLRTV